MSEPDILVRLRDCITYTAAHHMDGLTTALNDARDEIEALRSFADGCRGAAARIRAEALEEAARRCERYNYHRMAQEIRALKGKGDE